MKQLRVAAMLPAALLLLLAGLAAPAGAAEASASAPHRVKPGLPFLMSAILPGAGQLYLGHQRGYAYLGLDAAIWFTRFAYQDASFRKIGESEAFARRHWSLDTYRESQSHSQCDNYYKDRLYNRMKTLFQTDPHSFYETLAREDSLRTGWDDSWDRTAPDSTQWNCGQASANWKKFRDLRKKSDDLRNSARLALVVAVLNRVFSSVDALRLARRGEHASNDQGFHFESKLAGSLRHPRAEIKLVRYLP